MTATGQTCDDKRQEFILLADVLGLSMLTVAQNNAYAPGATGNVCTEDLVHMFEQMGEDTGVDLDALLDVAAGLPAIVGHALPGQVLKAGKADRRYPKPRALQA